MPKVVAVLQEMYDWRGVTSQAGYERLAPRYFRINDQNFTGKRLYDWVGHDDLIVTNACPQLVEHAKGRGTPDHLWLDMNLSIIEDQEGPFETLLVCGNVAQATFDRCVEPFCRVVYCPHPAARQWRRSTLDRMRGIVQTGKVSCRVKFRGTGLHIKRMGGPVVA